jgi:APA family basic amino acid/polyamine antiporter
MIGSGVFLSAGYMAQDLGPAQIMLSWVAGVGLALLGVVTYGEVARIIGRSGGEYRYLSELIHPWLGSLAGWSSLLIGFASSIAIDAYSAGAFLGKLVPGLDPKLFGAFLIIALTATHAVHLGWSKAAQNVLVSVKIAVVLGFVVLGLVVGSWAAPTWSAPNEPADGSFPIGAFLGHQYWVAFAFSGWNAAVYAAGEFRNPRVDVPRAMWIGCGLVGLVYLLVNWVFVANLTPDQAAVVTLDEASAITLGHVVVERLVGPVGGAVMSAFAALLFVSALSAMTLVGPRVYSEMAHDGVLPRFLRGRPGHPPTGSVVLQGALALGLLYLETLNHLVQSAAIVLLLFSGLTALSLFVLRWRRPDLPRPSWYGQVAAGLYLVCVVGLIGWGLQASVTLLLTLGCLLLVATVAWFWSRSVSRPG